MSLFGNKKGGGERFIAVFDIASASIGGAFVRLDPGKNPEIIFSVREEIPFQEKVEFTRFLDAMRKTLESVFVRMQRAGGGVTISSAYCVLASPWYASQTRLIQYRRPEAFLVTKKGVQKLLEKEIQLFRQTKLFARSHVDDKNPVIIESKNIQIKLNGYPLVSPFGKDAHMLEIALYLSVTPANIYQGIQDSIMKFWHIPEVHFSSFSFTAFDIIRDIFPTDDNFLFMDISGEVTDISLIRGGVLLESISFPAGKHVLIRELMKTMGTTSAVASSELGLYFDGKSSREHSAQIEKALEEATKEWVLFFGDALGQMAQEFPLPKRLFYTSDEDVSRWYQKAIEERYLSFADDRTMLITKLGTDLIKNYVTIPEESTHDPFLEIETIFAKKFISLTSS